MKLQDSGPLAARAAARPKAPLVPRLPSQLPAAGAAPAIPPTSAQKRLHGGLLSTPDQVKIIVHCSLYYRARIIACGGNARAHAALISALSRSRLTKPVYIARGERGQEVKGLAPWWCTMNMKLMVLRALTFPLPPPSLGGSDLKGIRRPPRALSRALFASGHAPPPRLSLVVHALAPQAAPRDEAGLWIRVRRKMLARMVAVSGHRGPGACARGGERGGGGTAGTGPRWRPPGFDQEAAQFARARGCAAPWASSAAGRPRWLPGVAAGALVGCSCQCRQQRRRDRRRP